MSYQSTLRFLRVAVLVLALAYGFLVILSVHEVSAAGDARQANREITSDLGALEVSYYQLTHELGLATVEQYGFKEVSSWAFVTVGGNDASAVAINTGARLEF